MSVAVMTFCVLLIVAVKNIRQQNNSDNWPTVSGKIISSEAEKNDFLFSHIFPSRYSAHVVYEYQINDQTYTSDCISLTHFEPSGHQDVLDYLKDYPKGKQVVVYVNPDNSEKPVLEPGKKIVGSIVPLMLFGVLLWASLSYFFVLGTEQYPIVSSFFINLFE